MPTNIVVCCDGTANEFAKDRTNVIKLYATLEQDPAMQVAYYHPGIGTMEPFGSLNPFTRRLARLLGMAVGYGLENDIRDAYVFLMKTYQAGDSIFLFGFSRGAFTVRAVASLLAMYGMLREGNETLVPYAIRMLMGIQRAERDARAKDQYFELAREFKRIMSYTNPRLQFACGTRSAQSAGWRIRCTCRMNQTIPISKLAGTLFRSTSGALFSARICGNHPRFPVRRAGHAMCSRCGFREYIVMWAAATRKPKVDFLKSRLIGCCRRQNGLACESTQPKRTKCWAGRRPVLQIRRPACTSRSRAHGASLSLFRKSITTGSPANGNIV